ncbi:MAG: class II fructose-bisphosphate aldolase [bacterium]
MTFKDYFKKAEKEGWAIGQFNVSNLEAIKAVLETAQRLKSPVIIGTSEGESRFLGLKQVAAVIKAWQEENSLPFILNLDHGKSFGYIKEAVEAGYQAVHFDGSSLPLKENIKETRRIFNYARKKNVLVEGEVGEIGGELTNAKEAQKFVKETGVDILAINVGTIHGIKGKGGNLRVNLQRLREVKEMTGDIPLVLHGGSGTNQEDIKEAIKLGVAKININTELRIAFTSALRKSLGEKPEEVVPYKYLPEAVSAVGKIVELKIKLFGSQNRG